MRQRPASNQQSSVLEVVSKTKAILVLIVNRSDKSYNADDTRKLALAAMRADTTEPQQKKAGFWTKKSLASATDAELAALGLQRIVSS
jgi:hypothetical protein